MGTELITGAGLATALGAKLLYDVCGPTAQYLGGEISSYTEIGITNLQRIFKIAAQRLQASRKIQGQVPSRVLKAVLSEGYFCEDELQSAYLGGVLASAKGPVSRDDRAISHLSLIESLSSYQLRTHCILYSSILRAREELFPNINRYISSYGITVSIRESDYELAMGYSADEQPRHLAEHSFVGLEIRGLSEGGGEIVYPRPPSDAHEVPFRFFHATSLGVELFLWGQGFGHLGLEGYTPDLAHHLELPFFVEPENVSLGRVNYS